MKKDPVKERENQRKKDRMCMNRNDIFLPDSGRRGHQTVKVSCFMV
jgi:hypothetical protein